MTFSVIIVERVDVVVRETVSREVFASIELQYINNHVIFKYLLDLQVSEDACAKVNCSHPLASCQVVNETATCVCPQIVTLEYFPVCGSDGVTYPNPGSLGIASCDSGGAIDKVKDGKCKCNPMPDCQQGSSS